MLNLIAPATYWILIGLWSFILYFYVRKMRNQPSGSLFLTLLVILAIDAFRTLFESAYFGLWYSSVAGLLPTSVESTLTLPYLVIIPKLINVVAAVVVIFLLLRRWLPQEEQEKRQSQLDVLRSEKKFRAFTSQSTDGIGVADDDGRYTYVNPAFCEMMGYSEAELLTKTVFDMKAPDQDHSSFERSKGDEVGVPLLARLQRQDGSTFLAEIVGNVIDYGDQKQVLGVVRDVTEREQAAKERLSLERQLQHAQKLESLGVLAGGIAHDFNNLLTSMLGNAQLALASIPEESDARESIHEIEEASHRAAELTKQMLDYSGRGRFVVSEVELRELVQGIAQLLSASISKKVEMKHAFDGDTPVFQGDPTQIRQIVMNLITNASEAIGDEAGTISLSTGAMECSREYLDGIDATLHAGLERPPAPGPYAFLEVADTGCGMDADTLARVFEPFFTTKFTGRGLGMAAVLGIIRGHGGALHVESAVGEGTTFRALFPVRDRETPEVEEASSTRAVPTTPLGGGLVLLAEDEEGVRDVGRRMLERLGFDVLEAADGQEALDLYSERKGEIACVLLDLTMPRMDGREVFREIRSQDPEAHVILCSGYSEHDAMGSFAGQGLAAFLHKPYGMRDLKRALHETLAQAGGGS